MKSPAKKLNHAQKVIKNNQELSRLMTAVGAYVCLGKGDEPVVMVGDECVYTLDKNGRSKGWIDRLQSELESQPIVVPLQNTEELNTLVHRCLVEVVSELYSNVPEVESEIQWGCVDFMLIFDAPVTISAFYVTDTVTDLDANALKAQFRSVLAKPAQSLAYTKEELAQTALNTVRTEPEYVQMYQRFATLRAGLISMFAYKKELTHFMRLINKDEDKILGNIKLSSVCFCAPVLTFSLAKVAFAINVETGYTTLNLNHMTSIKAFSDNIDFVHYWRGKALEVVAQYPGVEFKTTASGRGVTFTVSADGETLDTIGVRYSGEAKTPEEIIADVEEACRCAQRIVDAMLARIDALDPKSELLYCCIMRAVTGRLSNFHDTWPVMQVVKALRGLSFSGSYRAPANIVGSCKLLKEDEILHAVSDLEAAELLRLEWKHIHEYNTSYCTVGLSDTCSTFPPAKDRANALANFRPTHFGNTEDVASYTSLDWAAFVQDQAALAESGGTPDWERLLPLVEDRMVLGYCMNAFSAIFHTAPEPVRNYLAALVKMLPAGAHKNTVSKLAKA